MLSISFIYFLDLVVIFNIILTSTMTSQGSTECLKEKALCCVLFHEMKLREKVDFSAHQLLFLCVCQCVQFH